MGDQSLMVRKRTSLAYSDGTPRGFCAIGLVNPKTPANIGSVLRAAGCYGARAVVIEGARGHAMVAHAKTDTMNAFTSIPTILQDDVFEGHPVGTVPVAVELCDDAKSLVTFNHPTCAFYVFGPEDGTLGKKHLDRCAYRVFIPTNRCMNLAATVNVVLYDRLAKATR